MATPDRRRPGGRRSLLSEMVVCAAVMLLPIFAVIGIGVSLLAAHSERFQGVALEAQAESRQAADLALLLSRARKAGELVLADARPRSDFSGPARKVDSALQRFDLDAPEEMSALATLAGHWRSAQAAITNSAAAQRDAGVAQRFEILLTAADASLARVIDESTLELDGELEDNSRRGRRNLLILLLTVPLGIVLSAGVIRHLLRRTVHPLKRLQCAAEQMGTGDLSHRIEPIGTVELNGVAASLNDMAAALGASHADLEHRAGHDPLTGVGNRVLLEDRTRHALAASVRSGGRVGMIFLDLDGFKLVNDSLGHAAGDDLLRQLAARVQVHARGADTVARVGGDEFALLVEFIDDDDAAVVALAAIAERTLGGLAEPVTVDGRSVALSGCLGVAVSRPGSTFAQLLRDADAAMYRAKLRGPGSYEFFREDMHIAASTRLEQIAELHKAIEAGQFVLQFQPLIDLGEERTQGAEALVRWAHPERGMVPPLDFIPLAEDTGLIVPIGRWVLQETCRQAMRWDAEAPDHPPLSVGVNLSPRQLADPALLEDVREALRRSGLPAERLVLEITETALMGDLDASVHRLQELRDMGVNISMDDFGTGYSSLAYLRRLPLDSIKIARDFVADIEDSTTDRALVRGILEFGHGLGLRVVAEGIETAGQHARLRSMGCDLGQGWLYSRPVAPDAISQRLRAAPAIVPAAPGRGRGSTTEPQNGLGVHAGQLLRTLSGVSVQLFDSGLLCVAAEGDALARLGWQPEAMIGRRVSDVLPAQRAAALDLVMRAALGGRSRTLDWPSVRGDRHFQMTVEPSRDADNRIIGVLLVAQDVTEAAEVVADAARRRPAGHRRRPVDRTTPAAPEPPIAPAPQALGAGSAPADRGSLRGQRTS